MMLLPTNSLKPTYWVNSDVKELQIEGIDTPISLRKQAKTSHISIRIRGQAVTVSIPKLLPYRAAEQFVSAQKDWIIEQLARVEANQWLPTEADYKTDKKIARKLVSEKLEYWNKFYAFEWGRVAIRDQSTRWGSCSSQGNLNFNWKIVHLPNELQDYLIVHELCHLENPNHSKKFWAAVAETLPDHKQLRKKLKQLSLS